MNPNLPDRTPNTHSFRLSYPVRSENIKCLLEILPVLDIECALHYHVIHLCLHNLTNETLEQLIYQPLARGFRILQPKSITL